MPEQHALVRMPVTVLTTRGEATATASPAENLGLIADFFEGRMPADRAQLVAALAGRSVEELNMNPQNADMLRPELVRRVFNHMVELVMAGELEQNIDRVDFLLEEFGHRVAMLFTAVRSDHQSKGEKVARDLGPWGRAFDRTGRKYLRNCERSVRNIDALLAEIDKGRTALREALEHAIVDLDSIHGTDARRAFLILPSLEKAAEKFKDSLSGPDKNRRNDAWQGMAILQGVHRTGPLELGLDLREDIGQIIAKSTNLEKADAKILDSNRYVADAASYALAILDKWIRQLNLAKKTYFARSLEDLRNR